MNTNRVVWLITKIQEKANALILKELKADGITQLAPSHGAILNVLYKTKEQLRMADFAEKIHKDKSTVTTLVDKLSKLGYVQRIKCTEDSRITYISLTEKGWELEPVFKRVSEVLLETTFREFPEQEKKDLMMSLEKMYNNY